MQSAPGTMAMLLREIFRDTMTMALILVVILTTDMVQVEEESDSEVTEVVWLAAATTTEATIKEPIQDSTMEETSDLRLKAPHQAIKPRTMLITISQELMQAISTLMVKNEPHFQEIDHKLNDS